MSDRATSDLALAQARNTRARAWAYVFRCWQEKQMVARRAPTADGRNERNKFVNEERGLP